MIKKSLPFSIDVYASDIELSAVDALLLKTAREATTQAYAPYSSFNVGAAGLLTNGVVVIGTNQENASYPAGICAERVLLSAVASQFPGMGISSMAISYHNLKGESKRPISPCGICRQSLSEYEERTGQTIKIILSGMEGEVYVIEKAQSLLPLSFSSGDMK